MQDIGTSVDYMYAKQSSLLGNHSNLGKGSALGRNGPRLSGGVPGQVALPSML